MYYTSDSESRNGAMGGYNEARFFWIMAVFHQLSTQLHNSNFKRAAKPSFNPINSSALVLSHLKRHKVANRKESITDWGLDSCTLAELDRKYHETKEELKKMNSEIEKLGKERTDVNESLGDLNCRKSKLEESLGMAKAMEADRQRGWEEIRNEAKLLMGKLEREVSNHVADVDVLSMLRGDLRGGKKDWDHQKLYKVDKVCNNSTVKLQKERD
ncbi:hypothetical protein FOXB_01724 [Fusarium oxysporum f. sp. conglutinans Fo5176]|uniref:Uncharacterized protein n=1 Tax=Fusarium oxysporum (strain Fo5176) TaxID=660025 RepID=F9F5P9_FUSOF|nr:hypothetical protein FOXB_01724 [Fusarium oxysporum f. sp. conglutinans Fo5176]KAG6999928.1 hypothetical protein FocnCong_v013064 [Fusarium oxysporum f. sp. conglutinans]KAI8417009.1 hypothetical protein FOFC_03322 [Fusarium oxysporum]